MAAALKIHRPLAGLALRDWTRLVPRAFSAVPSSRTTPAAILSNTTMGPASQRLAALFSSHGTSDYIGEDVSIAAHSLQAAALARAARKDDDEAAVAALLHDVGHLLGLEAGMEMGMEGCGVPCHESVGAAFIQQLGLPDRVARLVGAHVDAKRFLCWRDPAYMDKLSDASKTTLRFQGGPMNDQEGHAWEADPDKDTYLQMRQWDEQAKDPDANVPGFAQYATLIDSLSSYGASNADHLHAYLVSDAQRSFWNDNGFLVIKGLANYGIHRQVKEWAEEISNWPKADGKWLLHWEASNAAPDGKIFCRAENFVNYHDGMGKLSKGLLADVVTQLVGEEAILFKEKINYKLPGGAGFAAHQDTPAYLSMGGNKHVSAMVAIDDATMYNGPLEVAAGRWGPDLVPLNERGVVTEEAEAKMKYAPVLCEAGDVVLFDGWTPHRSSANHSAEPRRAVFFTYSMARHGDMHAKYYEAKHSGAKGFKSSETISFQGDFQGKIIA